MKMSHGKCNKHIISTSKRTCVQLEPQGYNAALNVIADRFKAAKEFFRR